jgi:hypothetical protein
MALDIEQALTDWEMTASTLVESVNVTKSAIESRIAAAVVVSENAALDPLYVLAANQLRTQTALINYINN